LLGPALWGLAAPAAAGARGPARIARNCPRRGGRARQQRAAGCIAGRVRRHDDARARLACRCTGRLSLRHTQLQSPHVRTLLLAAPCNPRFAWLFSAV